MPCAGSPGFVFATTAAPTNGSFRSVHSTAWGFASRAVTCCGHPWVFSVGCTVQTQESCTAACVIAWVRQSAGYPGGVFEVFPEGRGPGTLGLMRSDGPCGRAVAIGVSGLGSTRGVVVGAGTVGLTVRGFVVFEVVGILT